MWVKDDGAYGSIYGGNKVRKLEWILPTTRAAGAIVTVGALGTNHGLATALYAREHGLRCAVALVDQPVDDHVRAQLAGWSAPARASTGRTAGCRTYAAAPWIMLRHFDVRRLRPPYFLTVGGSTPVGCVGFVEAAFELASRSVRASCPSRRTWWSRSARAERRPGLRRGCGSQACAPAWSAIVVNDRTPVGADVVARLANRTLELLRRRGADVAGMRIEPTDLDAEPGFLGAGYGHRTPEAERTRADAAALEQLPLDPVYTAKAMTGLLALRAKGGLGGGPVLFWQSHDTRLAA